jgi:hypothetical protein
MGTMTNQCDSIPRSAASPTGFDLRRRLLLLATPVVAISPKVATAQGSIVEFGSSPLDANLGIHLAAVGDVDFDGYEDVLAGDPSFSGSPSIPRQGRLVVFSGRTGARIHEVTLGLASESLGATLSRAGDLDGDGIPDFLAFGRGGLAVPPDLIGTGAVYAFSGATGTLISHIHGPSTTHSFGGHGLAAIGDVDLDGFPDAAVGNREDTVFGPDSGSLRIISPSTGVVLMTLGPPGTPGIGFRVADAGDPDQDGVPDVIVSVTPPSTLGIPEHLQVMSSMTGASLTTLPSGDKPLHVRRPDIDQDGIGDFVATENVWPYRVVVYSGTTFQPLLYAPYGADRVDGSPDIDGDGRDDLIVSNVLGVLALSGQDGSLIASIPNGAYETVAIGDINGDGFAEVVIHDGKLRVFSMHCGATQAVGNACTLASGITPSISFFNACFTPGGKLTMGLTGGLGTNLLLAGASAANVPIGGGCSLLLGAPANVFPVPMPFGISTGSFSVPWNSGLGEFRLQLFAPDASKPSGFASSKAMKITID